MSGSALDAQFLVQATAEMARVETELIARGYSEGVVRAATRRALGSAQFHTRYLSPGIRGQAFLETLHGELERAEAWIQREVAGMGGSSLTG